MPRLLRGIAPIFIILFLLGDMAVWSRSAFAETSRDISFDQALSLLMESSTRIKRVRQRIDHSESLLEQAKGARDWSLFMETGIRQQVIPKNRNGFLLDDNRTDVVFGNVVGVRKQFRNGVVVKPTISFLRNLEDDSDVFAEVPTVPNIEVTWPLLRGYGTDVAGAPELAANDELDATRLSVDHEISKMIHGAVIAYWQCLAGRELQASLAEMERSANEFAGVVGQLARAGELSMTTLHRVEADLSLRRLEKEAAQENLYAMQHNLAVALGLRNGYSDVLPLASGQFPPIANNGHVPDFDEQALTGRALESRADLQALDKLMEVRQIELKAAQNQLLPKLDLTVAADRVGMTFSRSFENRAAKGKVSETRTDVENTRMDAEILTGLTRKEVRSAVIRLRAGVLAYSRAANSRDLFASVGADTRREVTSGESGIDALIGVEDKLTTSTLKMIEAKLQYAMALADLRIATGEIDGDSNRSPAVLARMFLEAPNTAE